MNEIAGKITDAELHVMRVLWSAQGPLTAKEIKASLMTTTQWNGDTIKTLLRRLCEKGAVAQEKRDVYSFQPTVTEEDYERYRTQEIIDKLYSGSARNMVAALVRHKQLQPEDVEELRSILKAGEENG